MRGWWLFHWRTKLQRWCQKDVGILRRGPWALGELEDGAKLPELECRRTRPRLLEPHALRTSSVCPLPPAVLSPGSSSLSKGMWNHIFPLSPHPTVSFPSSIINAVTVEGCAVADVYEGCAVADVCGAVRQRCLPKLILNHAEIP